MFCNQCKLKSLNKDLTCYKNFSNPFCLDLLLKDCGKSFKNTCTVETGLSDFYKLVTTVLRKAPIPVSSRPEVFLEKGVIEIALQHGCSPVNLQHILGTPFHKNTSGHRRTGENVLGGGGGGGGAGAKLKLPEKFCFIKICS